MDDRTTWWSSGYYAALMCALMAVPLLWPDFPPLSDLPTHMGRYRIQAGVADAPTLAGIFSIHWLPIGNLGVDILVFLIQPLFGVEMATKIVVTAIPVIAAAGMFLTAREAHGRIPPTAAFALPFAYGYPFQFGFVNFSLAMALALLAFGVLLRLRRTASWRLRSVFLLLAGIMIYFAHIMGWMLFGLFCTAEALARRSSENAPPSSRLIKAVLDCLPLLAPLVFILAWRSGDNGGETSAFFDLSTKWGWIESALRERWKQWDGNSVYAVVAIIIGGLAFGFRWNRTVGAVAALLGMFYLFIPYAFFGLIYADMRIAPLLLAIAVLAMVPPPRWSASALSLVAVAATGFAVARLAATTASMVRYAQEQQPYLDSLNAVPRGAKIVAFVNLPCPRDWAGPRMPTSMAIVRRDAFVNDQFEMPGSQLLVVGPSIPEYFAYGDTEWVRLPGCERKDPLLSDAIAMIPQASFDFLWLLGVPATQLPRNPWLHLIRRDGDSTLYKIVRRPAA
jgi:hypothetical protein